jgi:hypothetical protein
VTTATASLAVHRAQRLARELLAEQLPERWRHVQVVAGEARSISTIARLDGESLICAAWLHDIGYSPQLLQTGFHPLDGARHLKSTGWAEKVCSLVANHSCARVEAANRGLAKALFVEFPDIEGPERDALWAADSTTGPDGRRVTLEQRVVEVQRRYGPSHVVAQSMTAIRPELAAAIARTRDRIMCRR